MITYRENPPPNDILSRIQDLTRDWVSDRAFHLFRLTGESKICDYDVGYLKVSLDLDRVSRDGSVTLVFKSLDDSGATFWGRSTANLAMVLECIDAWGMRLPFWETMCTDLERVGFFCGDRY